MPVNESYLGVGWCGCLGLAARWGGCLWIGRDGILGDLEEKALRMIIQQLITIVDPQKMLFLSFFRGTLLCLSPLDAHPKTKTS